MNLSTFLLRNLKGSDAIIFRVKIAPALEPFKTRIPLLSFYYLIVTPKRLTQNPPKSLKKTAFEAKGRLYSAGKVIQRIFNVDL